LPESERTIINAVNNVPSGFEKAGYGRILRFSSPQPLGAILKNIIRGIGGQVDNVNFAVPQTIPRNQAEEVMISSVGICAGSGGSMLNGLDVELLFTGELSHHEALAAIEQGKCVVTTCHSNSERGFLRQRMRKALDGQIKAELKENPSVSMEGFEIQISEMDRDPYSTYHYQSHE
jgi:putative NIF3 family GTP cyclohydrolase 1 type 2